MKEKTMGEILSSIRAKNNSPEPNPQICMRATLRLSPFRFSDAYLPRETLYQMMQNQVTSSDRHTIPDTMLEWCEDNCEAFWMPVLDDFNASHMTHIMFASTNDMTLFLTAFGGG